MVSELSSNMEKAATTISKDEGKYTLHSFAHATTIKLTEENFLVWKMQITTTINGFNLQKYLIGDKFIPDKFATAEDAAAEKINQDYLHWVNQDQLLMSWLISSMTEEMVNKFVECSTTKDLWEQLRTYYSTNTKPKERQLRNQLRETKKGNSAMNDYLSKIKKITNALASIGASLSTHDHVETIFDGLSEEYESFVTSISLRTEEYSVSEIEALLLAQEARVEKFKKTVESVSANMTLVDLSKNPPSRNQTSNQSFNRNNGQGRGNFRNNNFQRGRGRSSISTWQGNRPQCQVCGKMGHIAVNCYNRFNQRYTEASLLQQQIVNQQTNRQPAPSTMEAMVATPETLFDAAWYPDSGASNHLTNDSTNLQHKHPYDGTEKVYVGNGQGMSISHIGEASIVTKNKPLTLKQLIHAPQITKNLISVSKLAKDNKVYFEFHANHCLVKSQETNETLLKGSFRNGLYCVDDLSLLHHQPQPHITAHIASTQSTIKDFNVWHSRLGHPSSRVVSHVLSTCNISIPMNKTNNSTCHACCLGKSHTLPFSLSQTSYSAPLQLVHTDIWGHAPILSSTGYTYYISFIDAYSKFTWLYLLKTKGDALQAFIQFKNLAENQLNTKIKAVQSDFGGEYRPFTKYLTEHGIHHRLSCPHTHPQNGIAERKHKHITEIGLTLLAHASMPLKFWDDAFRTAVFLINRLPTPLLHQRSPLEVLFSTKPNYLFLKTFGCTCYPHLRPYNPHKFAFKSAKCTFIGYSLQHKGYKCLHPSGRIYISRHVHFDENDFPFAATSATPALPKSHVSPNTSLVIPLAPKTTVNSLITPTTSFSLSPTPPNTATSSVSISTPHTSPNLPSTHSSNSGQQLIALPPPSPTLSTSTTNTNMQDSSTSHSHQQASIPTPAPSQAVHPMATVKLKLLKLCNA
ncbi:Retrovirus-related Pol polyprotein from transposon TNT 1-94 [Senna tora]|uniref:Retrovirus-related Pol polyprotein from transposon TNT 1-94 n=1 Tax=Senna tora TaxID=362788 RepID=A0A834T6C6_9FABA|nr:Retrovirus-related Pol polyprotein from transposon TNT 1-94 [Senna tora]